MIIGPFEGRYAFLSNFYPSPILMVGGTVPTVEHAYVAAKAGSLERFLGSANLTLDEYASLHPGKVKRMGRKVDLREDWSKVRVRIMYWLVKQKFLSKELSDLLIGTGNNEIRELNWWHDQFWGDCTCKRHQAVVDGLVIGENVGRNWLGRILMEVRDELKAQTIGKMMWGGEAMSLAARHSEDYGHDTFIRTDNRWFVPFPVNGTWSFGLPKYKVQCVECLALPTVGECSKEIL